MSPRDPSALRVAAGIAAAAAPLLLNHLLLGPSLRRAEPIGIVVALGLIPGAMWLTVRMLPPRLTTVAGRAWVLLPALAAAAVLMAGVPIWGPYHPRVDTLVVTATGSRNAASQGTGIALRLKSVEGDVLGHTVRTWGCWERLPDGSFRCDDESRQPARLVWRGVPGDRLRLILAASPTSGIARVRWRDTPRDIDLYAAPNTLRTEVVLALDGEAASASRSERAATGLFFLVELIAITLLVALGCSLLLCAPPLDTDRAADRPARFLGPAFALMCAIPWAGALLVLWPGVVDPDSLDQWRQALTGQYNDWHPAFHTLTKGLVMRVWASPAAIATVQIIALSTLAAWGLLSLRRIGVPVIVLVATCVVFAVSPANLAMVITLWKDSAYGIALLGLSIAVLNVGASAGAWLRRRWSWLVLGSLAALVALYRHNGPAPAFGTLILLMVAYRAHVRALAAALGLALVVWIGVRGPLYRAVDVAPKGWVVLAPLVHQLAAHVDAGTPLTPEEAVYLGSIRPLADGWRYSCHSINPTLFDGHFNAGIISETAARVAPLWRRLTWRRPRIALDHLVCSSGLIWRISQPPGSEIAGAAINLNDSDLRALLSDLGIAPVALLPSVQLPAARVLWITSHRPELSWLFWRPAFYLYTALAGAVAMSLRTRDWRFLVPMLPIALHTLALLPIVLVEHFRFQYAVFLVGLLIGVPLLAGAFVGAVPPGRQTCRSS